MGLGSILDRGRTVAKPGFSRWMVPPAALCIHLCIGQVYAFSVFNLPMTRLIGIAKSAPDDWKLTDLVDLLHRDLLPRRLRGGAWPLGRGGRAAPGNGRLRPVLRRRVSGGRLRLVGWPTTSSARG